ncbi:MAG: hypothetical protein COT85_06005 [Chlamydiae bacterium CG10_big_fil_rev_8_21_14_0_10_42_34]|nr:MAG: hypothetical protein COT85_06005 [Chlamydiae bacterium CG10_big_fil_rev_8_21_14_0_10_42_34]
MKKRSFLLLEVLFAFTLVIVCAVPLVKQPLKLYRSELEYLEKMELERLADWTFTEIKESLLKNEILWEKIPTKNEKSALFPLSAKTIEIPGSKNKQIKRQFFLKCRGEKRGKKDEIYRQLGICIYLNESPYWYRLPIQKVSL